MTRYAHRPPLELRFRWMPRCASTATTEPGWNGCCAIARARPSRWSGSSNCLTARSLIAFPGLKPDGRTELRLTPLELIERLTALIPSPRIHRRRYHGVLHPTRRSVRRLSHWLASPHRPSRREASPTP